MDMYSASLVPVVSAPSELQCWAALGVWDVQWTVMGVASSLPTGTDDFGSLVIVLPPSDLPVLVH